MWVNMGKHGQKRYTIKRVGINASRLTSVWCLSVCNCLHARTYPYRHEWNLDPVFSLRKRSFYRVRAMCHALPMSSLVPSPRLTALDSLIVSETGTWSWLVANTFASVQDRHDDTHHFDSKNVCDGRVVCGSLRIHRILSKTAFPTQYSNSCSAHTIEFDNSLIRTRPTLPPCSRGQMVAGFSAGRVPINVRSAPSAPFRFGYEYTNIWKRRRVDNIVHGMSISSFRVVFCIQLGL